MKCCVYCVPIVAGSIVHEDGVIDTPSSDTVNDASLTGTVAAREASTSISQTPAIGFGIESDFEPGPVV